MSTEKKFATLPEFGIEKRFRLEVEDRSVPGVVWIPKKAPTPCPLVLIGHGGSGHKTSQLVLDAARPLVEAHDFIVAAIDGPVHGERRPDFDEGPAVREEFRSLWAQGNSVDPMIKDWEATLSYLCSLPEVDPEAVGWYGISMGTAYGLPFVSHERRIRVAVLGMWGTSRLNSLRLVDDARHIEAPVLFQRKISDEFFTSEGQLEIFEALASKEKSLKDYEGTHTDPAGEQLQDLVEFLVTHLKKSDT